MNQSASDRKKSIRVIVENMHAIKNRMLMQNFTKTAGLPGCGFKGDATMNITPSQWMVLVVLVKKENMSIKDVAKSLGISSSAATQLVDGLVNKDFLTREVDPSDHRTICLKFSSKYKKHISAMNNHIMKLFSTMFEVLDNEELENYATLSQKVASSVLGE